MGNLTSEKSGCSRETLPLPAGCFAKEQLLPISENEMLFQSHRHNLRRRRESTFALPDLRGAFPVHQGQGPGLSLTIGEKRGASEQVTLTVQQMPAHNHPMLASLGRGTRPTRRKVGSPIASGVQIYIEAAANSQ